MSVRCKGLTKKEIQCKLKSIENSEYCKRHQKKEGQIPDTKETKEIKAVLEKLNLLYQANPRICNKWLSSTELKAAFIKKDARAFSVNSSIDIPMVSANASTRFKFSSLRRIVISLFLIFLLLCCFH